MKLYALVAITADIKKFSVYGHSYNHWDSRCVGIYQHLQNAIFDIGANTYDIYEDGYYPFAVIEELESDSVYGLDSEGPLKQYWFEWKDGAYKGCEKPKKFELVVGFWG